jgi:hypothetical protein
VPAAVTRDHRSLDRKEIEMTKLLAVACLAVGIGVAASASPSAEAGADKIAKTSAKPICPKRAICLYRDANLRGTKHKYHCRGRSGPQPPIDLGRSFRYGRVKGVSSYQNNGVDSAKLKVVPRESALSTTTVSLRRDSEGDIKELFDDEATELRVTC